MLRCIGPHLNPKLSKNAFEFLDEYTKAVHFETKPEQQLKHIYKLEPATYNIDQRISSQIERIESIAPHHPFESFYLWEPRCRLGEQRGPSPSWAQMGPGDMVRYAAVRRTARQVLLLM